MARAECINDNMGVRSKGMRMRMRLRVIVGGEHDMASTSMLYVAL